jgi:hypothetical protein
LRRPFAAAIDKGFRTLKIVPPEADLGLSINYTRSGFTHS